MEKNKYEKQWERKWLQTTKKYALHQTSEETQTTQEWWTEEKKNEEEKEEESNI